MFSQAFFTGIQGGKLFVGFAAGSLSSVMSSLWQGGEHITDNGKEMVNGIGGANPGTVGTMFFGTISGGAGAAISGGNFWQGAVTGLVVSGMNHTLHDAFDGESKETPHQRLRKESKKINSQKVPSSKDYKNGESVILKNKSEYVLWDNKWHKTNNLDKNGNIIESVKMGRGGSMSPKQHIVYQYTIQNGAGDGFWSGVGFGSLGQSGQTLLGKFKGLSIVSFAYAYLDSRISTYLNSIENMTIHDNMVN